MYSGNILLKTLRGNTLPCAPVSTFTRIHAVLRGGVGNCTLMCVSASSRVIELAVTGLKYNCLGLSQEGGGVLSSRSRCVRCLVVGGCIVDILCGCCLEL